MAASDPSIPVHLPLPAQELIAQLRTLKQTHRLSLSDIAGKTHYSKASWHRWLRGERLITAQALSSFVEITECDGAALHALLVRAIQEMSSEGDGAVGRSHAPGPLDAGGVTEPAEESPRVLITGQLRAAITGVGIGVVAAVLGERLVRCRRRYDR